MQRAKKSKILESLHISCPQKETVSHMPRDTTDRRFRCLDNAKRWLSSRKDLRRSNAGESGESFTGMLLPGSKTSSLDLAKAQMAT